ncbi:unnamed protein product [Prorocentrum cordatum]|uniref:Uncharacterized protein n=1 Tax=Prorocentrum cordatum TaxID=2364126 RepID=A0ABN9URL7_9DINO|nr:unnamed protein product [Polarella glacialis]
MKDDGLPLELLTLCDAILRQLDGEGAVAAGGQAPELEHDPEQTPGQPQRGVGHAVPFREFARAVRDAAAMSGTPEFWRAAEARLSEQAEEGAVLSLDEVTVMMLSLLREAILWQHDRSSASSSGRAGAGPEAAGGRAPAPPAGLPVLLHIYDVSQEESVQKLNKVLAGRDSWFKLGGAHRGELSDALDEASLRDRLARASPAVRAAVLSETLPGASGFLTAMSSKAMKLSMEPAGFRTEVQFRLAAEVFQEEDYCSLCDSVLDVHGFHCSVCTCGGDKSAAHHAASEVAGSATQLYEDYKRTYFNTEAQCSQQGIAFVPMLGRARDGKAASLHMQEYLEGSSVAVRRANAQAVLKRAPGTATVAPGAADAARVLLHS